MMIHLTIAAMDLKKQIPLADDRGITSNRSLIYESSVAKHCRDKVRRVRGVAQLLTLIH